MFRLVLLFVLTAASIQFAYCCTSLCVSANATDTRHAFVTYNADDSTGYGYARFFPAGTHLSGSRRKIVDGDSRVLHGDIPEAEETFNVVHRANEHGVAIGESTWEGLKELQTPFPGSILDYESLIDLALQRATNAIEAAGVITGLAELYGWVSLGESFSIADKKDTIILEVIGKGKFGRGVVWILRFIPQGTVTAHANQPRITTCPAEDCLMHPDTIPLARQLGYSGTDEDFSFSDFFQPLDPATVRACEARVWSAFQKLTNGGMNEYLDYAKGWDLTKRMPLYVVPAFPVTRQTLFDIMRDTYGGTFFAFNDTDQYVGAGPYSAPYRSRPLEFNYEGHTYVNERPIGTQQTLTSQIAEIRTDESIPRAFRTVVWFSVDDTVLSVRLPIYTGVSAVPPSFSFNSGDVMKFSLQSAFWAFNLVANLSYTAFSYIAPIVQNEVQTIEAAHEKILAEMDDTLRSDDSGKAIDTVSRKIVELGENLTAHWIQLWQQLFMEYKDTYILKSVPGQWQPEAGFQEVPQSWYARVVKESGNRFLIPSSKIKEPKKQD